MNYRYNTVKKDFDFLDELDSGGDYVEISSSCFELMAHPNKDDAKTLYLMAIEAWFSSLKLSTNSLEDVQTVHARNKKVILIGKKYGHLD
tara:strand:- start:81 stop:350 length:270 start_codon:yes stop_codon:yes gene_type:complete